MHARSFRVLIPAVLFAAGASLCVPAHLQEAHAAPKGTGDPAHTGGGVASKPAGTGTGNQTERSLIDALTGRPVPLVSSGTALTYHEIPVNTASLNNKEKLVSLKRFGIAGESFYYRTDGLNAPYFRRLPGSVPVLTARDSVARKLAAVNTRLRPCGLELFVFDSYRPVACQASLWQFFMAQSREKLPNASESELKEYAGRYCSCPDGFRPDDSRTWPTHNTGGAVDLTLRRRGTGELLFMGGVFDDPSSVSSTCHFEKSSDTLSARTARQNRRILYWAMTEEGFANYPFEWWHFDYGNQMWVQNSTSQKGEAFYGPAGQQK